MALGGAEIVCAPSNWDRVADRYYTEDLRVSIAATHAHLNEVVMACADRVGEDEGLDFVGRSVICDPRGIVAGPADAIREDWLLADVRLEKVRNRWSAPSGHLASRRKDVYSLVASPAPAAERESQ